MCLVVFNWQPRQACPLMLVANRDEFHARPTEKMHWWPEESSQGLLAGRDLQAGGSWMAFDRVGRFAVLTNIREGYLGQQGARSRGEIPIEFIRSKSAALDFAQQLKNHLNCYTGFNILLGEPDSLYWMSSDFPEPQIVEPGIHGLSNAALDTPWPKVELAKKQLQHETSQRLSSLEGLSVLTDRHIAADETLPNTGISLEWERMLSAQTIVSTHYGTRSRCFFRILHQGDKANYKVVDQQLDIQGALIETQRFDWAIDN